MQNLNATAEQVTALLLLAAVSSAENLDQLRSWDAADPVVIDGSASARSGLRLFRGNLPNRSTTALAVRPLGEVKHEKDYEVNGIKTERA